MALFLTLSRFYVEKSDPKRDNEQSFFITLQVVNKKYYELC